MQSSHLFYILILTVSPRIEKHKIEFMLPANYIPNYAEMQKYLDSWGNLDDCVRHEVALNLFSATYLKNTEVSDFLIVRSKIIHCVQ